MLYLLFFRDGMLTYVPAYCGVLPVDTASECISQGQEQTQLFR